MPEKKRRLIDDLLQDDFFGIKQEKKEEKLFDEEIEEEKSTGETTISTGELFEEELIEEESAEEMEKAAQTEISGVEETKEEKKEEKKSSTILVLVIILILLGGGGAGYFFLFKSKKPLSYTSEKIAKKTSAHGLTRTSKSKIPAKASKAQPAPTTHEVATKKVTVETAKKIPQQPVAKKINPPVQKVANVKETRKEKPVTPYIPVPRYSLRAGPMDENQAKTWESKLQAAGWNVRHYFTEEKQTLFFIDLGIMDRSKAMAQKLKIELFMPDQKGKVTLNEAKNNKVRITLGPYNSAVIATSVIQRLKTPKLNIEGKIFTKLISRKKYFLKIGKFTNRKEAEQALKKFKAIGLKVEITGL